MENEKLKQLARDLSFHHDPEGYSNAQVSTTKLTITLAVLQSMVICKQPEIGGKVPEHNDS